MAEPINEKTVDYLANLARIRVDAAEAPMVAAQLESILRYVEKLNELNTDNVEPFLYPSEEANKFRSDKPIESVPRAQALANAPDHDNEYVRVPTVIE